MQTFNLLFSTVCQTGWVICFLQLLQCALPTYTPTDTRTGERSSSANSLSANMDLRASHVQCIRSLRTQSERFSLVNPPQNSSLLKFQCPPVLRVGRLIQALETRGTEHQKKATPEENRDRLVNPAKSASSSSPNHHVHRVRQGLQFQFHGHHPQHGVHLHHCVHP